jgi:hypothetical protein
MALRADGGGRAAGAPPREIRGAAASLRQSTHQVQFNIHASGVCSAGVAEETDGIAGGSAWPTQPATNPFAGMLVTVVLNAGSPTVPPTAELELTGATIGDGVVAHWIARGRADHPRDP